jgi:hypothetical protein
MKAAPIRASTGAIEQTIARFFRQLIIYWGLPSDAI